MIFPHDSFGDFTSLIEPSSAWVGVYENILDLMSLNKPHYDGL